MSSPRANRVPGRIKEILAEQLTTLKDPRIGFVTITDVRTTPDFARATVFYTVLPSRSDAPAPDPAHPERPRSAPAASEEGADSSAVLDDDDAVNQAHERTAEGLASATPVLRRELGRRMRLRQVPTLEFVLDPVPAQGRRIEDLLDEARTQR